MRVARIVSLLVVGAAVIAPMRAQAQGDTTKRAMAQTPTRTRGARRSEQAQLRAEAKITQDSARKIALAQVPNGKVAKHELERENGTVVYSFDIRVKGQPGYEEVNVSAIDGSVVSKQHETAAQEKAERKAEKKGEKAEMKIEKQEAKPKKP
jgi:uncharacterized membrane protein YkoI